MVIRHRENGKEFRIPQWMTRLLAVRRRVFAWANVLKPYLDRCGDGYRLVGITLSYQHGEDWKAYDINRYIRHLKGKYEWGKPGEKLHAYAWVAEIQQRGVIHYHLMLLVSAGTDVEMPDKTGHWPYGLTRRETVKGLHYLCAYVGKEKQKKLPFPRGARVCASGISKRLLDEKMAADYRAACAPAWVRKERERLINGGLLPEDAVVRRFGFDSKGGWYADSFYLGASPFELVSWRDSIFDEKFISWVEGENFAGKRGLDEKTQETGDESEKDGEWGFVGEDE